MKILALTLFASAPFAAAQFSPAPFAVGAEHQFSSDLDGGSSFSYSNFRIRGGIPLYLSEDTVVGISAGYIFEDFNFDDTLVAPWSEVHRARAGLVATSNFSDDWSMLAATYLSSNFESGADFGESITYGGLAAAWYRVNDNLSLGMGGGFTTSLEDDATIFPLPVIIWKINECMTFSTLPAEGFRFRPGANLNWDFSDDLTLGLVYQYQSDQQRLDEDSAAASDGIGELRQHRVSLAATYRFSENFAMTASAGVALGGELEVQDSDGDTLFEEDFDTSIIVGLEAALSF